MSAHSLTLDCCARTCTALSFQPVFLYDQLCDKQLQLLEIVGFVTSWFILIRNSAINYEKFLDAFNCVINFKNKHSSLNWVFGLHSLFKNYLQHQVFWNATWIWAIHLLILVRPSVCWQECSLNILVPPFKNCHLLNFIHPRSFHFYRFIVSCLQLYVAIIFFCKRRNSRIVCQL